MAKDNFTTQEPWLAYLNEEIASPENLATYETDIDIFMKEYLLSSDAKLAEVTACRIDKSYWETYLPSLSIPPENIDSDGEMEGFLGKLYNLIVELAVIIPCGDTKQEMLLQLLLELRKLPPKTFKYGNQDHRVYHDPIIGESMDEVYQVKGLHDTECEYPYWPEESQKFINLTSFLALCFQRGIDIIGRYHCKFPVTDILDALEEKIKTSEGKKFRIKVAANWILKAGPALYEAFAKHPSKNDWSGKVGPEKWGLWAAKFKGFWGEYEDVGDIEMASIARNEYEKMRELDSSVGSVL